MGARQRMGAKRRLQPPGDQLFGEARRAVEGHRAPRFDCRGSFWRAVSEYGIIGEYRISRLSFCCSDSHLRFNRSDPRVPASSERSFA